MLLIIEDPTGTHRPAPLELDCAFTLHENVARHIEAGGDYEAWLNGERVAEPSLALSRIASCSDNLILVRRPAGFDPFTLFIIAVVAILAVTILMMPKPQFGNQGSGTDSPNNRLTGQANVARTYEARPDVYGNVRCWPDLIQNSTFEYVANVKRVTEWMCVSRGKGTVTDIQYADTPLADFAGAVVTLFEPTAGPDGLYENGTTTITDVMETFDSPEVNGQELGYAYAFSSRTATCTFDAVDTESTFTLTTPVSAIWDELITLEGAGSALVSFSAVSPALTFLESCPLISVATVGSDYVFTFGTAAPFAANYSESLSASITPAGSNYTTIGPYTLPVAGDRLAWHVNFLRGLKGTVWVRAEWWAVDDAGTELPGTRQSQDNASGADSFDAQYRTFTATPSGGFARYRIQFQRRSGQVDADGIDVAKLEEVTIGRHYASRALPGDTIIKVITTATNQATGFSERKFNCEWTRHVRGLTGTAVSPSRNFARAIVHMWAVAGRTASQIDIESLAAINATHGETSELLRFDYTFADRDVSLGERIQVAANAARCKVYRDGTQWVTYRDELRPSGPSFQLDYRNLAADGDSSISESGHLPASEDGVEVDYVNEDGKTKAYVRLLISPDGVVSMGASASPQKITLTGCRTTAQALNRAHLEARKIIYQRRRVSDTALMDAASMGLGEVVRWIDPNDFLGDDGLQAGEVLAISGSTITTSERLDFGVATSGRIVFTDAEGRSTAHVIATPRTDSLPGCVLASVPDALYVAAGDRQCGSRYSFGAGLTESEMEASSLYVIESKKPSSGGTFALEMVAYDEKIYEMD